MPAPFVQGCLTNRAVSATIETRCARSGWSLTLEVDDRGDIRVRESGASPLLFEPEVDWESFRGTHIRDVF